MKKILVVLLALALVIGFIAGTHHTICSLEPIDEHRVVVYDQVWLYE